MKTAIVAGATGLIGGHLVRLLLADDSYDLVKVFVRRPLEFRHPKLSVHVVDFERIDAWRDLVSGDELFSAMGTTLRRAGSRAAQYRADVALPHAIACAASENGVGKVLLVSSSGANRKSGNFYLRIKGELEEKIAELPFERVIIFRPSLLTGKREVRRFNEEVGGLLLEGITRLIPPLRRYRSIPGETVAKAMVASAGKPGRDRIFAYALDRIFAIGR